MRSADWRRYLAPAAFLLAVTLAVVLVRAGLESGSGRTPVAETVTGDTTTSSSAGRTTTAKTTTSTTTKKPSAAKRYWTVQAGDTFGVIATKTGVPVATIEQLNPTVKSTSLFIGERIRVK